jgi:hypothetical protein
VIAYPNLGRFGRLGNALFEFASTVGVARTLGERPIFPADWIYRPYFSIPNEMFAINLVMAGYISAGTATTPMDSELTHHMDPRCRPYLQDVNLFWHCIDEIREYLAPSNHAVQMLAGNPDYIGTASGTSLGIHVRRSDKVGGADPGVPNNLDYHLCMSLGYYKTAEREVHDKANEFVRSTVIISDDVIWCQQHWKSNCFFGNGRDYFKEHDPLYGTTEPSDWIDLFTLAACDYLVVTGSTFGIWGAILANVPPDHVVRPSKVYGPLNDFIDESILFPAGWRVVDAA